MALFPREEIKRKLFHQLILLYAIAYWFLDAGLVVSVLSVLFLLVVIGEVLRHKNKRFNQFILKILGGVHREEESSKISGLPWTLSGSIITMLLFKDKTIVFSSLLFLVFGDTFAALIGKGYGKHKLWFGKSLEGSFACFVICFLIALFFFNIWLSLIIALIVAVIEFIPWPLNDNFWIPIITASAVTFILR